MGVVGLAENIATQPSLAGAWAELGNRTNVQMEQMSEFNNQTYFYLNLT